LGAADAGDGPVVSPRSSSAEGEATHKVIAPAGVLDISIEGVTLWHDYGSFALYRVTERALQGLPVDVRSRVSVVENTDRLLFANTEIDTQATLTKPAAEAEAADMVVLRFSGPVEEQWLLAVEETGAKPLQSLGPDSYLVWADAESRAQLDSLVEEGKFLLSSAPHTLDVQPPTRESAAAAVQTAEPGAALQLVQFVGPIKDEWLEAISATSATPIQYIATYGYLLWADADSRAKLDAMVVDGEFLQFSAPYPTEVKVGPALAAHTDPAEVVPVVIQMYRHDARPPSESAIQDLMVEQFSDWTPILAFQNVNAAVRVGDVGQIASLPDVFWIEERLERHLLDEVQGQILAGNFNADQSGPGSPGYLAWLNSYGFSTNPDTYPIMDVTDDGIGNGTVNSGDPTLHQLGDILNVTRLAYVANCTNSASGEGVDGHGHINVSIAGGYDTRSGFPFQDPLGYQRGLGINPYSRLARTRIFDPGFDQSGCGGSDTGVIKSIQDNGALINTNSWGCSGCAGSYDDSSQAYDVGVRDADLTEPGNQEMIILFSAGNSGPSSGTVGTPGNGKNIITVGASENQRPSDEDGSWTDAGSPKRRR